MLPNFCDEVLNETGYRSILELGGRARSTKSEEICEHHDLMVAVLHRHFRFRFITLNHRICHTKDSNERERMEMQKAALDNLWTALGMDRFPGTK